MYLRRNKAIYIHIPKTAGTSIKAALKDFGEDVGHKLMRVYGDARFDDHYFFTSVRNTYDRLLSFAFYLGKSPHYIKTICQTAHRGAWKFLPITDWLDPDRMNRIIRYDNLQNDFDLVCDDLGIPRQSLPLLNKTQHDHYSNYYTDELRRAVEDTYADEIEAFGFTFETKTLNE